jgi:4-aminobutyrate aminotransferase-like enzyme
MLSLRNSYHGMTQALAGATNLGNWKQPLPHGFGILKSLCPDPYRGVFVGGKCRDSPVQPYKRTCDCAEGTH